ncbi:MAG: hypothetical protein EBU42_05670 [Synechococcus sp.]|nr:hypothetical protein [Synechococcus sp.]
MAETTSKGPLSYLSGSLTSGLFCAISVWITLRLINYYSLHPLLLLFFQAVFQNETKPAA